MANRLITQLQYVEMLACPKCRSALQSTDQCDTCGLEFSKDGDTPQLFAPLLHQTVQFEFSTNRTVMNEKTLQQYINDPPPAQLRDKLPYHLAPAHGQIINELPPNQTILEIGCGGGQTRQWFQKNGHRYLGVDISKVRVYEWLQKFGGPDILCDAHFLPFREQQFDVVYSVAVTEHLACPYLAAQEIFRVLKPGGYYLGNVSFLEPWHDSSFFHMSPLGVIELLIQAGFQIKYVWPERGYSSYQAIFAMGNRLTKSMTFIGKTAHFAYQLENHIMKYARRLLKRPPVVDIYERAKVTGAIFWIAVRPEATGG